MPWQLCPGQAWARGEETGHSPHKGQCSAPGMAFLCLGSIQTWARSDQNRPEIPPFSLGLSGEVNRSLSEVLPPNPHPHTARPSPLPTLLLWAKVRVKPLQSLCQHPEHLEHTLVKSHHTEGVTTAGAAGEGWGEGVRQEW